MKHTHKIILGDVSGDGYEKTHVYHVKSNKSAGEFLQIQDAAKKKLGIDYLPWEEFCIDYEGDTIPASFVNEILSALKDNKEWTERLSNVLADDLYAELIEENHSDLALKESLRECTSKAIKQDVFANAPFDMQSLAELMQSFQDLLKRAGANFDQHIWWINFESKADLEQHKSFFESLDHKDKFFVSCSIDMLQYAKTVFEKNALKSNIHTKETLVTWNNFRKAGTFGDGNNTEALFRDVLSFYKKKLETEARYQVGEDGYLEIMFAFLACGDGTLEIELIEDNVPTLFEGGYGLFI